MGSWTVSPPSGLTVWQCSGVQPVRTLPRACGVQRLSRGLITRCPLGRLEAQPSWRSRALSLHVPLRSAPPGTAQRPHPKSHSWTVQWPEPPANTDAPVRQHIPGARRAPPRPKPRPGLSLDKVNSSPLTHSPGPFTSASVWHLSPMLSFDAGTPLKAPQDGCFLREDLLTPEPVFPKAGSSVYLHQS